MSKKAINKAGKHSGRGGDPISLDPLTFDEALDALANPPTDESSSEADPEFDSEDSGSDQRPTDHDD